MVLAHQQTLICRAALLSLLHASKQVRCTMQRRPWPWPCRLHAASPPAQVAASAAVAATGCEQLAAAPAGGWHLMAHHGTVGHLALAGERGSCAGRSWHGGHAARGSTARPAGRARCSGLRTGGRRSAGHRIRGAGPGSKAEGTLPYPCTSPRQQSGGAPPHRRAWLAARTSCTMQRIVISLTYTCPSAW